MNIIFDKIRRNLSVWQNDLLISSIWLILIAFSGAFVGNFLYTPGIGYLLWPGSGMALACLLLSGNKYWPSIWIGALLGNMVVGNDFGVSFFIGMGSLLGAILGFRILEVNQIIKSLSFERPRDYLWLTGAAAAGALVSAVIGVSSLWLSGVLPLAELSCGILRWFQGDLLGAILVTPLILVWRTLPWGWFQWRRKYEIIAFLSISFLSGQIIFCDWFSDYGLKLMPYWMFVIVFWAALRFGRHGTLLVLCMVSLQSMIGASNGVGTLARNFDSRELVNLWFYLVVLSLLGMAMALSFHALRETRREWKKLALVAEKTSNAVVITDAARRILWVNEGFVRMTGYTLDDVKGKNPGSVLQSSETSLVSTQKMRDSLNREESCRLEILNKNKYGKEYWTDIEIQPIRNHEGKLTGFIAVQSDITEMKLQQKMLRTSEERYRILFNSVYIGVFVTNQYGVIEQYNQRAAELWGRKPVCGVEKYCGSLRIYGLDGRQLPHEECPVADVLRTGRNINNIDVVIERPDGTRIEVLVNSAPLKNDHGEVMGVVTSFEDITVRRTLEAQLRQSQKMDAVGQLAGGVAHEFNNLLSPMRIQLDMIAEEYAMDHNLMSQIESLRIAVEESAQLTRKILDIGRMTPQLKGFEDINSIIEDSVELIRKTIDREIQIDLFLEKHLPLLFVGKLELSQILINLLINARDAIEMKASQHNQDLSRYTGLIRVFSKRVKKNHLITRSSIWHQEIIISDNGIGMDEDVKKNIFIPFYTTKDPGRGTGLGLSVVWNIVESLNGVLTVESHPGIGSSFCITLPETVHNDVCIEHERNPQSKKSINYDLNGLKILLVDDDEGVVRAVSRSLQKSGCVIQNAENGRVALNIIGEQPDAWNGIITDLNMPLMGGQDMIRSLKLCGFKGFIIVMSGYISDEKKHLLEKEGIKYILYKPFKVSDLIEIISNASRK